MTTRTYVNNVNPVEVSLAIERLLVADYPVSWTPARIDLEALPSGFYDLGSVVEDSTSFKVTREKFTLETGLPKVRQFEAVMGLEGTFEGRLHSASWRKVQFALGNYAAVSSAVALGSISSVHSSGLTFVLSSTPTTPLVVGRLVVCSSGTSYDAPDALEVVIASINNDNRTFTVKDTPFKTITTGLVLAIYDRVTQWIGGRSVRYYSVLGVADFLDGSQIIHEMRKVSPANDWEESFRPDQNGMVPLSFSMLGFNVQMASCTEQVIAGRHYFPPISTTC